MKYLFIIPAIFITTISFSQNEILFGINGGATYSNTRGNTIIDEGKAALDFLYGFAAEFQLNEKLSIKTNLNYERKSTNIPNPSLENVEVRSTYNYLSLPVMVKYSFGSANDFYLNGGPFVAFLLSAKSKSDGFPSASFTDLNKSTDLGLSFGVGKRFDVGEGNYLDIEIRNNLGLTNISATEVIDDGTVKTNSINLILSYFFSL